MKALLDRLASRFGARSSLADAAHGHKGEEGSSLSTTLFFELHGSSVGVEEQASLAQEVAAGHGGLDFQWSPRPEDRSHLRQARHDAYYACVGPRPGARALATEVRVPTSRLADCIGEPLADLADSGLTAPLVGHVGDLGKRKYLVLEHGAAALDVMAAIKPALAPAGILSPGKTPP